MTRMPARSRLLLENCRTRCSLQPGGRVGGGEDDRPRTARVSRGNGLDEVPLRNRRLYILIGRYRSKVRCNAPEHLSHLSCILRRVHFLILFTIYIILS
jgi:hypothetical protein